MAIGLMGLLKRSAPPTLDYALWLIYSLVIGWLALHHEPWRDEVRALSIAKAATSLPDLLRLLHNEGHPPLWYLLLKLLYMTFHTNAVLQVAAWAIASLSALIVLRRAPFSAIEKILFMMGTCPLYEYAIICREYGLSMLLMFVFCANFRHRFTQPWRVYLPLMLLALSNVYAAMIAGAFAFMLVIERTPSRRPWTYYAWPLLVGLMIAFSAWLTFPDRQTTAFSGVFHSDVVAKFTIAAALLGLAGSAGFFFRHSAPIRNAFLIGLYILCALSLILSGTTFRFALAGEGIIPPNLWLFAFFFYFLPRTCLLFILAAITAAFSFFHLYIYAFSHMHQEIMFCFIISLLWIERSLPPVSFITSRKSLLYDIYRYRRIFFPWLFIVFLACQLTHGLQWAQADLNHPYSASADVARRIRENPAWHAAILMGEPDYLMEPLPYYLNNPIYFPRSGDYGQWTLFTQAFKSRLTLGHLLKEAHKLHRETGQPVLVLLRAGMVRPGEAGHNINGYGHVFGWGAQGYDNLLSQTRFIGHFEGALTDENYDLYEMQ